MPKRIVHVVLALIAGFCISFVIPPIKRSHAFGGGTIGGSFSTSGTPFTGTATFPGSTAIVNLGGQSNVGCPNGFVSVIAHWSVTSNDTGGNNSVDYGITVDATTPINNNAIMMAPSHAAFSIASTTDATRILNVTCTAGSYHTLNFLANLTLTPGSSPPQISVEALIAP